MKNPSQIIRFAIGLAALALLADCAGGDYGAGAPSASAGLAKQNVTRAVPFMGNTSYSVGQRDTAPHAGVAGTVKTAEPDVSTSVVDGLDSEWDLDAALRDPLKLPQGVVPEINGGGPVHRDDPVPDESPSPVR